MTRCKHSNDGKYACGSYAFNLEKEGIDQGALCDRHYWQVKYEELKVVTAKYVADIYEITKDKQK